jgi:hypothetical protein
MQIKKVALLFLFLSMIIIIYLFIKEQFRGIILTHTENMILSACYLVTGVSLIIMMRKTKEEK